VKTLIAHHHRFELWRAPTWLRERLQLEFPDNQFVQLENFERVPEEIRDADVFIASLLRPEHLASARKLKWIHSPAAAVHGLMFPELIRSNVRVTNSTGVHGPVVAEHAVALLLAMAKRLPQAMHYQAQRVWAQDQLWRERPRPREVDGATVLVVGMGGIGSEFARRAKALGMKVLGVRENPNKGAGEADKVFGPAEIDVALPQADYVVLCAPVTLTTTGVMNEARINLMKPEACIINVGRGALIVESDLVAALRKNRIAGAALDVFDEEPLPESSSFWSLNNVLITPHTAAVTDRLWERHCQLIIENMNRFLSERPLLNEVDKKRGY
jgi:phosphoglycerate dehydrogenase-like enzyme